MPAGVGGARVRPGVDCGDRRALSGSQLWAEPSVLDGDDDGQRTERERDGGHDETLRETA